MSHVRFRSIIRLVFACAIILVLRTGAFAQVRKHPDVATQPNLNEPAPSVAGISVPDYVFGPGDVVQVSISDSPELSGSFQVDEKGYLTLPLLTSIRAAGLNGSQLTKAIANELKTAEIVTEPIVNVSMEEYHSRTVLVLGAVARPAVYPLRRSTTLLEVISLAGGLTATSGNIVTVARKNAANETAPNGSLITVDLGQLVRGNGEMKDIEVRDGDVVNVSTAPVIYVVGAVKKAGGFVVQDPASGITVLQALALGEGLLPTAAPRRGLLLRRSQQATDQQDVPIDLARILAGKGLDQVLRPNDILFVPESGSKKTIQALARAAEQGAVGIATYGLGLRIGN